MVGSFDGDPVGVSRLPCAAGRAYQREPFLAAIVCVLCGWYRRSQTIDRAAGRVVVKPVACAMSAIFICLGEDLHYGGELTVGRVVAASAHPAPERPAPSRACGPVQTK